MDLKQKRFMYEKAFSVEGAIKNLKSYQVARGEADPSVLTKKPSGSKQQEKSTECDRKRRKRRKYKELFYYTYNDIERRKLRRQEKEEKETSYISKRKEKEDYKKLHNTISRTSPTIGRGVEERAITASQSESVGSLGLLASHYSSSDNEEEEGDYILSRDQPMATDSLTVPDAILGMYGSESENSSDGDGGGGGGREGGSSSGLGYFEAPSDSSDDETSTKKLETITTDSMTQKEKWDPVKAKWKFPVSNLQTYVCSNCGNVGHFAKDCTVITNKTGGVQVPVNLKALYSKAHKLARSKDIHCAECGITSNLVCCLDCRSVHCDGRGHLSSHLLSHPSHNCLFSCKLNKVIKCSNGQCDVVNVYELYVCGHCLSNAFSHHYSMITATWTNAGLRKIQNAIACEDHFHWHRVNCPSSVAEETLIARDKLHQLTISEFFF